MFDKVRKPLGGSVTAKSAMRKRAREAAGILRGRGIYRQLRFAPVGIGRKHAGLVLHAADRPIGRLASDCDLNAPLTKFKNELISTDPVGQRDETVSDDFASQEQAQELETESARHSSPRKHTKPLSGAHSPRIR